MDRRFRSNSPPVIQETIAGETIMVNLETGSYYWLDPVASYICIAMEGGASVEEVVDELSARFPAAVPSVDHESRELADRLVEEALLVPDDDRARDEATPRELPELTTFGVPV